MSSHPRFAHADAAAAAGMSITPINGHLQTDAVAEAILAHCRARLPTLKVPRGVGFAQELPRSDAGKLYRKRLRARYWSD